MEELRGLAQRAQRGRRQRFLAIVGLLVLGGAGLMFWFQSYVRMFLFTRSFPEAEVKRLVDTAAGFKPLEGVTSEAPKLYRRGKILILEHPYELRPRVHYQQLMLPDDLRATLPQDVGTLVVVRTKHLSLGVLPPNATEEERVFHNKAAAAGAGGTLVTADLRVYDLKEKVFLGQTRLKAHGTPAPTPEIAAFVEHLDTP